MRKLFLSLLMLVLLIPALAQPKVLITYHSQTGNTRGLAEAVAMGASEVEGVQVVLKAIAETTQADLLEAAAIIVGSPVYNANVAPAVQAFIASWPFEGAPMKDKLGAAFVTAGGISAGEELTQMNILHSMLIFGMIVVGGPDWTAPFGASAIVGEAPFDQTEGLAPQFIQKGEALGRRVAELALRLNP
ncbi:MAG: flavodoxin family protein [Bacteroides sp.]|jgi:NAD(P)H dehydrogenase (quinone)|nr:flavodoxin family protein [Bacteroides sp.]